MDIKDLRGEDGSFSEDKVGDLINKFTDLKGKNEDLSTKVSQFDEQKNTIINDTKNSLLNIGDGMSSENEPSSPLKSFISIIYSPWFCCSGLI
jgi:hypothetical protein